MFNKEALDKYFAELRAQFANEPDWEQMVRDSHLGIARSDAGVSLGQIDARVQDLIGKHAG